MANPDPLYDTEGACIYLGGEDNPPARRTLERWRQTGDGPRFVRVGRAVRYRRSDLDAWLESRVRSSTSEQVDAA
jgi:hypothetical protein